MPGIGVGMRCTGFSSVKDSLHKLRMVHEQHYERWAVSRSPQHRVVGVTFKYLQRTPAVVRPYVMGLIDEY